MAKKAYTPRKPAHGHSWHPEVPVPSLDMCVHFIMRMNSAREVVFRIMSSQAPQVRRRYMHSAVCNMRGYHLIMFTSFGNIIEMRKPSAGLLIRLYSYRGLNDTGWRFKGEANRPGFRLSPMQPMTSTETPRPGDIIATT